MIVELPLLSEKMIRKELHNSRVMRKTSVLYRKACVVPESRNVISWELPSAFYVYCVRLA